MKLVEYKDAPEYMQYEYVYKGYRILNNYKDCFKSIFKLHNETFNIWSMIFINGLSLFLTSLNPIIGLKILTFSALIHLPFSLGYHIFMPLGKDVSIYWRKLDVSFIFISSIFLALALDFYIFPLPIILIHITMTTTVAYIGINNFWKTSNTSKIDHAKHCYLLLFIVICYYFPILCKVLYDLIIIKQVTKSAIIGLFIPIVLFICGFSFAKEWPQYLFPGKFDLVGNSHNIVHITAGIAHILEYLFILENYLL